MRLQTFGPAIASVMLLACGSPEDTDELGALRVAVSGLPAEAVPELTVTGPGGFTQGVGGTATLTDLEVGTYTVDAPDVAVGEDVYTSTPTPASVSIGAGLTETISVVYTVEEPDGPVITSVAIVDYGGSLQVRQGAGSITLEILGEELGGATIARLGDIGGDIDDNNDSSLIATFEIGPGTPVGPLALEIVADAGIAELSDALTVTATTAGGNGDDDTGRGTPDRPLRSIRAALSLAPASGDVVLLPGTYDEANGESWPVELNGRRLRGSGAADTILSGPGSEVAVAMDGRSTVADIQITGFTTGVRVFGGRAVLRGLDVWGNTADGFSASASATTPVISVDATDCVFRENGVTGFEAVSAPDTPAVYTLTDVTSRDNGQRGIYLVQSVQMTLIDSTIEDNDFDGILLIQDTRLDASGITVRGNDLSGIEGSGVATLNVEDSLIRGQQERGIDFSGASLRVRDTDVLNNVGGGVRIAGEPFVDLGTVADPGNNRIGNDGAGITLGAFLHDDRSSNRTPTISAVGVDLGANPHPTGIVTGPDGDEPFWVIDNDGNQIDFGN